MVPSSCLSKWNSYFTPDTYANKDSAVAARLAAGLCADLASAIYTGRAKNGFALVKLQTHYYNSPLFLFYSVN